MKIIILKPIIIHIVNVRTRKKNSNKLKIKFIICL